MTISPEALCAGLDAIAHLGCVSEVTVDEEAWGAMAKAWAWGPQGPDGRRWGHVLVKLRPKMASGDAPKPTAQELIEHFNERPQGLKERR